MCLSSLSSKRKKIEKSRLLTNEGPLVSSASSSPNSSPRNSVISTPRGNTNSVRATLPANRVTITNSSNALRPAMPAGIGNLDNLINDVNAKWSKPNQHAAISTDFPRLVKMTTIYVGPDKRDVTHSVDDSVSEIDNAIGDSNSQGQTVEKALYSALITLSIYLHDPTTLKNTKDHFWEFHKGDIEGEVSRNFGLFLKNNLNDETNTVICVLKSINQMILAPAMIALKVALPGLPFKDYRNSWRVKIFIGSDDSVDIVHVRREQSFGTQGEEMKFEFVWELRISIALGKPPQAEEAPPVVEGILRFTITRFLPCLDKVFTKKSLPFRFIIAFYGQFVLGIGFVRQESTAPFLRNWADFAAA